MTALLTITIAFTALLTLPAGWLLGYHAHARTTATHAEATARPARQPIGLEDGVVRVALAAACCERWWTSAGTDHEAGCRRAQETA